MASERVSTHEGFLDYMRARRPLLQDGYDLTLSRLLEGVAIKERDLVMDALRAGKKIRGSLSCLVCEGLGGSIESAIPRAVAIELIQAATLIHDDFVDQDVTRGGRPAVWTLEGPQRAVLIGDVMFAAAIEMMSGLGAEDGRAASRAIAEASRGALHEPLDPRMLADKIASDGLHDRLYDKIIRLKTGVLFGVACTLGAIAARGDEKCREACHRCGLSIGEAYQIADDVAEIRKELSRPALDPRRMVALAPALLRFVPERRTQVEALLRGSGRDAGDRTIDLFRSAAALMEQEIESRLRSARSAIEGVSLRDGYDELVRGAPRDIVAIFHESCGPA
jgi:geranylgeranyl pyrophosphate synthase